MTVESLLKVIQKGTDVILKDKSEKELLRFSQGNDLNAVSFEYLNRKILVLEPHGNSFTAILEDETAYSYTIDRGCKENAIEVDDFPKLYTADQMQEYAKAKVFEALKKYGVQAEEWSDHEAELAYKQMTKFIFEEDTKND